MEKNGKSKDDERHEKGEGGQERKPYVTPKLSKLGKVQELTNGADQGVPDSGGLSVAV